MPRSTPRPALTGTSASPCRVRSSTTRSSSAPARTAAGSPVSGPRRTRGIPCSPPCSGGKPSPPAARVPSSACSAGSTCRQTCAEKATSPQKGYDNGVPDGRDLVRPCAQGPELRRRGDDGPGLDRACRDEASARANHQGLGGRCRPDPGEGVRRERRPERATRRSTSRPASRAGEEARKTCARCGRSGLQRRSERVLLCPRAREPELPLEPVLLQCQERRLQQAHGDLLEREDVSTPTATAVRASSGNPPATYTEFEYQQCCSADYPARPGLPPYAIGSLAAFWVIDRLRAIFEVVLVGGGRRGPRRASSRERLCHGR